MAVNFNHTVVRARDSEASATFLAEILGLPFPKRWGPFLIVTTNNGTNLNFINADGQVAPQHYAFLVSEAEFDEVFGRVRERSLPYWADPAQKKSGEINHRDVVILDDQYGRRVSKSPEKCHLTRPRVCCR